MGYMRHHAIIVTSWERESLEKAHAEAKATFPDVTSIAKGTSNGYCSFLIPPDGSKEGWDESKDGDKRREDFLSWLEIHRYDGDARLQWAEVQFGDEDGDNRIIQTDADYPEGIEP